MVESPLDNSSDQYHLNAGSVVYAEHWIHEETCPAHTHSFVEIAVVVSGEGVHHSLAGPQPLAAGDVVTLRPGVWHGYEQCRRLDLFNCCFSTELLRHELAWTREDPLLGYLLWSGPYSGQRRGILKTHLDPVALSDCVVHLDALDELRRQPVMLHRGDIIGHLSIFLSGLARVMVLDRDGIINGAEYVTHGAVIESMQMMEARPAYAWTLTELADSLHLAPRYLVRLFKAATGLPPMAYLARLRIELAAARLLHTDDPIGQIGESVGWPDPNYFARRFRTHYGVTASTYRARFTHNAVQLRTWAGPEKAAPLPVADAR
jgi:AraC-like DNA-binding protein/mannose-6-phosphate isomerase-like protein (cupin superfamily)